MDAAHIHQFADSRNNHPQNGLALSKNVHWMFDAGLWSLDDDYRVLVATNRFDEAGHDAFLLKRMAGWRVQLPGKRDYWPDKMHLAWHRKNKFTEGQPNAFSEPNGDDRSTENSTEVRNAIVR